MRPKPVWVILLLLAVVAVFALAASPAGAVVGGQLDGDLHPNVGMLEVRWDPEGAPHDWYRLGSCTLVGEDVVLTAAHCVDFFVGEDGFGVENLRVTFDQDPANHPEAPRYYAARIAVHPVWLAEYAYFRGNSKSKGLGPGAEDVALVWLKKPLPRGITPAKIVAAGGLDGLDLTSATFTVVGYGLNGFVDGNLVSEGRNPNTYRLYSGRNYKDVSVITEDEAFADRYLKITVSLGNSDSGGPLFYKGVEVADNTWGYSLRCEGPCASYRLDAPLAQEFLHAWLGPEHFVALP